MERSDRCGYSRYKRWEWVLSRDETKWTDDGGGGIDMGVVGFGDVDRNGAGALQQDERYGFVSLPLIMVEMK